jgi:RNA polymerase sigma factor (sigma-70 family)
MVEPVSQRCEWVQGSAGAVQAEHLDSLPDEELVRRFRDMREKPAFAEMLRRHQAMVFRTCVRLLGNVHDSEDATQSVFLVLAQRPEVVRRSLAGCLHELARAAVGELCRARRRRSQREEMAARISSLFRRLRGGFQPMEHQELREELDVALAELPDSLRQAVILRYLEGHSQQEAAQQAGCTQVTMGWRSMKGLQQLRKILGRRGVVSAPAALLAILNAEARAAATLSLASTAPGGASAMATQVAAALLRRSVLGAAVRKFAVVAVLATAALSVGAGVVFWPRSAKDAPANPNPPAPLKAPAPVARLGVFDSSMDIGKPARPGMVRFAGNTYTVQGGGQHIYDKADQFRFVYRKWSGDGEIIARVSSDPKQKAREVAAGVMFRESLTPGSRHAAILISPIIGHSDVKYRTAADRPTDCNISRLDDKGKHWVRLVRRGNTFTAYIRPDTTQTWKPVKEIKLALKSDLYVGLAVTAHNDAELATTLFDHVSVQKLPRR